MKRNFSHLLGVSALLVALIFSLTGTALAADPDFPWTTNWSYNGYLANTQGGEVKAKSTIRVSAMAGPIYKVTINLRGENLPANGSTSERMYAYQAWLVDRESGWRVSIGTTIRKNNGTGDMGSTQYMTNPKMFDTVEISQEPLFDMDAAPSTTIYSAELNIPAFTEFGYKLTFSPKNLVPPLPNSNKGGTGKFIINTKTNKVQYRLDLKNIPEQRKITIFGPARAGATASKVADIDAGTTSKVFGTWTYDQSIEEKLLRGEYYMVIGSANADLVRGQITF